VEIPLYFASTAMAIAPRLPLSPDTAILCFTLGLLLIYLELNRPGTILPGAVGLLITLLAIAALLQSPIHVSGVVLIAIATGLLLLDLLRQTPLLLAVSATAALIFGFLHLTAGAVKPHVHVAVATGCGLILGTGTSLLTRLARRARANKGLDLERARTSRPGALKS
jgi:membrane-bound serine protease (ClpP class)